MEKAKLIELDQNLEQPKDKGKNIDVQFNPESLKVSYSNKVAEKAQGGSKDNSAGPAGRQFVGTGTTKLTMQLWFDASTPDKDGNQIDDVRRLTKDVLYFITPQDYQGDETKKLPPGIRFQWGSFSFDGLVDSLDETLEYFSSKGLPLRASISLNLSQEKILIPIFKGSGKIPGIDKPAGTQAMDRAKDGDTMESITSAKGNGNGNSSGLDVFAIAQANDVENLRNLAVGQLIDLNVSVKR